MHTSASKPLRVVFVAAESLADGFAPNRHVLRMSALLKSFGHHVTVVGRDDGPYHAATDKIRIGRYLSINIRMFRLMAKTDVIVTRAHFAHLPWTVWAGLIGKPVVHIMNGWVSDTEITYKLSRFVRSLIRWSYRQQFNTSHTVVCVTEEIAEKLRRFGNRIPVLVVPNTAYPQTVSLSPASSSGHYAIFPSSLSPWHGVETLLKATLSPHWPENLTVVIAGEGQQLPMALDFAERSPRVRCVGVLKTDELAKCMLGARMGLCLIEPLPNREVKEVYPLKLFEMMAFRLPVIATDLAGQRDVISHSNAGILVPPGDPEALAKAVSELNSSPSRELMAEAAVTAVLEMYNRQDSAAQFDRIISEAANGGRRR